MQRKCLLWSNKKLARTQKRIIIIIMGKYVNLYNYFEGDIEAKVWFNSKEVPYYRSLIRTGFCI